MTKGETEDYDELMDVQIREYLENHQLPRQLVEEIARKYLDIAYVRERIRAVYPDFLKDIAPHLKTHNHEQDRKTYKRHVRQEGQSIVRS